MTRRMAIPGFTLALVLAAPVVATGTQEPTPSVESATAPQGPPIAAWLSGPFGAVLGGSADKPATAAPDDRALDTWMRQASLELVTDPPLDSLARSEVVARQADGGSSETVLARDQRWFMAPDEAGLHVVIATLENEAGHRSEHAWLVNVPDREGSWETLLEMPMPGAELRGQGGIVQAEPGHGCYVGMCQEVGLRPPAHSLEALRVGVGEELELHLGDGSALIHWEGRLEPQAGTLAETRLAQATFDEPVAGPALRGLEPDTAGEWLLEVRADYDRERGWQWFLFRLVAE